MSQIHFEVSCQHEACTQSLTVGHVKDISDTTDLVVDASMGLKLILQNFHEGRIGSLLKGRKPSSLFRVSRDS